MQRPEQILGSLDGSETGVRQLILDEPLETTQVELPRRKLTVPTAWHENAKEALATVRKESIATSLRLASQSNAPCNRVSSSSASKTDRARVKRMKDQDIRITAEHPEAEVKHIVRGIVRRGLKAVPAKTSVSLRIDADVLEWFKAQGPGYQTRMNAVLRAFKDASL